jgi:integrase
MAKKRGFYRRNGVWWVRTDPVTGKPKSTKSRDFEAAQLWQVHRERIAADPSYASSLAANLLTWVDAFLDMKRRDSSEATVEFYTGKLGHFLRVWGEDCRLATIDAVKVDTYCAQRRAERVGESTLDKEVSALTQMLKLAKRSKAYAGDISTLRPPDLHAASEPRTRSLTREEVAKLRANASPRAAALVAVCVGLGCRRSEAGRITREDIDLEAGRVTIAGTKTPDAKRVVPVISIFRELIESALPFLPLGSVKELNQEITKACKRAGIPHASPNDLRRTHATWMLEDGIDRDVVRRLLGHTTTRLVDQVYGRPSPEALSKLAEERLQIRYTNKPPIAETRVTDGDRTRDVRSHIPNPCLSVEAVCAYFPVTERLRTGGRRWGRVPADTFSAHGYWAGRRAA